jgi:hypothetical protein
VCVCVLNYETELLVTRSAYRYLVHIRILKSFIEQINAFVGLSDDD